MGDGNTDEQNGRTYLEVRTVVANHTLKDLGMQKSAIEKSGKSLFEDHPDQTK